MRKQVFAFIISLLFILPAFAQESTFEGESLRFQVDPTVDVIVTPVEDALSYEFIMDGLIFAIVDPAYMELLLNVVSSDDAESAMEKMLVIANRGSVQYDIDDVIFDNLGGRESAQLYYEQNDGLRYLIIIRMSDNQWVGLDAGGVEPTRILNPDLIESVAISILPTGTVATAPPNDDPLPEDNPIGPAPNPNPVNPEPEVYEGQLIQFLPFLDSSPVEANPFDLQTDSLYAYNFQLLDMSFTVVEPDFLETLLDITPDDDIETARDKLLVLVNDGRNTPVEIDSTILTVLNERDAAVIDANTDDISNILVLVRLSDDSWAAVDAFTENDPIDPQIVIELARSISLVGESVADSASDNELQLITDDVISGLEITFAIPIGFTTQEDSFPATSYRMMGTNNTFFVTPASFLEEIAGIVSNDSASQAMEKLLPILNNGLNSEFTLDDTQTFERDDRDVIAINYSQVAENDSFFAMTRLNNQQWVAVDAVYLNTVTEQDIDTVIALLLSIEAVE